MQLSKNEAEQLLNRVFEMMEYYVGICGVPHNVNNSFNDFLAEAEWFREDKLQIVD